MVLWYLSICLGHMEKLFRRLLVANRGEIALRIMSTAADLSIPSVAIFSTDDASSLHTKRADDAVALGRSGAAAYLDMQNIVGLAERHGCDAIHPGYGFLSENAEFARLCAQVGIRFVGPAADNLEAFGDKVKARALARSAGVPIPRGTEKGIDAGFARKFLKDLGTDAAIVVKAVAGGGGRGIRVVSRVDDVDDAVERCQSEARTAFGNDEVYVEEFIRDARHIEIQIAADANGDIVDFGERECSVQRQRQKLVEIAPSPSLSEKLRKRLIEAATVLARAGKYQNLGTFEFLVRDVVPAGADPFVFLEANPRIQVEHTVTEEVYEVDLVRLQLEIAAGKTLEEIGRAQKPGRTRFAIQARINAERIMPDGALVSAGGTISSFDPPLGRGVRVDTSAYKGYSINPSYDPLLAKLIVSSSAADFEAAASKAYKALSSFRISGVNTNIDLLQAIVSHADFVAGKVTTLFLEEKLAELTSAQTEHKRLYFEDIQQVETSARSAVERAAPPNSVAIRAPMQGTVVSVLGKVGHSLGDGRTFVVLEAMKLEHSIPLPCSGLIRQIDVAAGDVVLGGQVLGYVEPGEMAHDDEDIEDVVDPTAIRPELQQVLERRKLTLDAARPEAVLSRHRKGRRTARENIAALCDSGSFVEYGGFVIAAQRARRSLDDLIRNTPADGQICGLGTINGAEFGNERTQCAMLAYDYTVFAGTQGHNNHLKTDRLLEVALKKRLPVVLFAEGGGGRPGDTEGTFIVQRTFNALPKLSGKVPLIGITAGYCFAGNAAVLGVCDVIIATKDSNIGMGGPAMVEGGGLGVFKATEIGDSEVQSKNGVIDILVENEQEAVTAAKKYLSYFQGDLHSWSCANQELLRGAIPADRRRIYDLRKLVDTLADTRSVLELRRSFGLSMLTAFIRIEGRAVGLIANDPGYLAGAIDREASDKAARFMQLCDAYDIPIVSLCDTPGIMVGPESERTALVRHSSRLLLVGANLDVPLITIVTRKAYGLGKAGMTAGTFKAADLTVSWPTGEFGPMNFEGGARLAHRRELEAIADPRERAARLDSIVAELYEGARPLLRAMEFEIDDVIDPAETRRAILAGIQSWSRCAGGKRVKFIDSW